MNRPSTALPRVLTLAIVFVFGASHLSVAAEELKASPEMAALLEKAGANEQHGQYDQAIFDYSEALFLHPSRLVRAEIYALRGGQYVFKRQFEKAQADADEAIRLASDYFRGYQTRARLFMNQGQLDRALVESSHAIQLEPNFAGVYITRGDILARKEDHAGAIKAYSKALELNPMNAGGYGGRATVYQRMDKLEEALADYHQALLLSPYVPEAYYNRAMIYRDKVQDAGAICRTVPRRASVAVLWADSAGMLIDVAGLLMNKPAWLIDRTT